MKERPQSSKLNFLLDPLYDADGVQRTSGIGVDGKEYPDPVPMAPPVGYSPPVGLEQLIMNVIRRRDFNAAMEAAGAETFEEADDFEVGDDDYDPRFEETIYEKYFEAKSKRAEARVLAAARAEANQRASVDLASDELKARMAEKRSGVPPAGVVETRSASSSAGTPDNRAPVGPSPDKVVPK